MAVRAAASAEKFAIVVPVTNPAPLVEGKPSRSTVQASTISSNLAATGDMTCIAAFWSHAPASQFAASAAGSVPPMTNPK